MSLANSVIALIIAGLAAYVVLAGADFGAGFWELTSGASSEPERVRNAIHRSVGPVWEANHVWLIFVLVLLWTGFPQGFAAITSTLSLPLFLAAAGIVLRGAAFAFQPHVTDGRGATALRMVFGVSSVLTLFMLGAAIGGVASGRVPAQIGAGDAARSWLNPTSALIGALAVATGAYLAAVYLAADSNRSGDTHLADAFQRRALAAGVVAGGLAIGGLAVVREDSRSLWDGLMSDGLPAVVASSVFGVTTIILVYRRRYGPARLGAAAAVGSLVVGWALAQQPYLLPDALTIAAASAGRPTLLALLVGTAVGGVILVPSLILLFRLTLTDRLSHSSQGAAGEER